jgi:hypothetical protein
MMELHREIIYTTKMSKQVTKSHVRDAVLSRTVPMLAGAYHQACPQASNWPAH